MDYPCLAEANETEQMASGDVALLSVDPRVLLAVGHVLFDQTAGQCLTDLGLVLLGLADVVAEGPVGYTRRYFLILSMQMHLPDVPR